MDNHFRSNRGGCCNFWLRRYRCRSRGNSKDPVLYLCCPISLIINSWQEKCTLIGKAKFINEVWFPHFFFAYKRKQLCHQIIINRRNYSLKRLITIHPFIVIKKYFQQRIDLFHGLTINIFCRINFVKNNWFN